MIWHTFLKTIQSKIMNVKKLAITFGFAAVLSLSPIPAYGRIVPEADSTVTVYTASPDSDNGDLNGWGNGNIICSPEYTYSEGGRLEVTFSSYGDLQCLLQALSLTNKDVYRNLYPANGYITGGWITDNKVGIDIDATTAEYLNNDGWETVIKGKNGVVSQIDYTAPEKSVVWRELEYVSVSDGDFNNWNNAVNIPATIFDNVEEGDRIRIFFSSIGGDAMIQLAYNHADSDVWTQFVDSEKLYSSPYEFTVSGGEMLAGFRNDGLFIKGQDATVSEVIILTQREVVENGDDEIDVSEALGGGKLIWSGKDDMTNPVKQRRAALAFDNDPATYTNFGARHGAQWVGVAYDSPMVIKAVRYMLPSGKVNSRSYLGVFQGANDSTFIDAMPLAMVIPEEGKDIAGGEWQTIEVTDATPYRFVRYVGPGSESDMNRTNCVLAELRIETAPAEETLASNSTLYRPTILPLVIVNTQGDLYFDNNYENKSERNTLTGSRVTIVDRDGNINVQQDNTEIRGRGNFSWSFPKKPFRIKFGKSTKVLGSECKAKKWTMINNYGDKTLIRNMIGFEMSRRMELPYTPNSNLVDLIFNGQYMGTYQLCDQIDIRPGRVDIHEIDREKPDPNIDETNGGFLVEIDAYAVEEKDGEWFLAENKDANGYGRDIPVTVKSPDAAAINPLDDEIYIGLKSSFTRMTQSVFDELSNKDNASESDWGQSGHKYEKYLDLESMLRYIILEEYMSNPDAFWSCYMYKDHDEDIWHVGPVWDFDIALGNYKWDPENFYGSFIPNHGSYAGDFHLNGDFSSNEYQYTNGHMAVQDFLRIILDDKDNKALIRNLWTYFIAFKGLNAEKESSSATRIATKDDDKDTDKKKIGPLNEYIDKTVNDVKESARLNFMRWPILDKEVHDNLPGQSPDYMDHINFVKDYLKQKQADLTKAYGWNEEVITGVESIEYDNTLNGNAGGPIRYFNLQGMEVKEPHHGIFIRMQGNKTCKVRL